MAARYPPPPLTSEDPFAFLGPLGAAKDALGNALQGALGAASNAPVLGGGLQGLGTAGQVALTPLNLIATLLADERAKRAAAEAYRTEGGDVPDIFNVPAVARAVSAGRENLAGRLGAVAGDISEPAPTRALSGTLGGILDIAPNIAPIPFIPRGGGTLGEAIVKNPRVRSEARAVGQNVLRSEGGQARVDLGLTPEQPGGQWSVVRLNEKGPFFLSLGGVVDRGVALGTEKAALALAARRSAMSAGLEEVAAKISPAPNPFVVSTAAQIEAAGKVFVRASVGRNEADLIRRGLRTEAAAALTPEALVASPTIGPLIDQSLRIVQAELTPEARLLLARDIISRQTYRNEQAAAAAAKRTVASVKKLPEVAAEIERNAPLAEPVQTFNAIVDAAAAVSREANQLVPLSPDQLSFAQQGALIGPEQQALRAVPPGGGGLPPTGIGRGGGPPLNPLRAAGQAIQGVRALVAGGDFSQAGRQLFPILFAHPRAYIEGNIRGIVNAFQNDAAFAETQASLRNVVSRRGLTSDQNGLFLAEKGGGIVRGAETYAGLQWIRDIIPSLEKIPILGGYSKYLERTEQAYIGAINATRVAIFDGAIRAYERAYGRALSLPETQAIAKDINIITGRGFKFPKQGQAGDTVLAVATLANGLGFSPQFSVARAILIPETIKSAAQSMWDVAHGRAMNPGDIEMIRLGAGYAASVVSTWAIARAAGLNVDIDPSGSNFGKVELGKQGEVNASAIGIAEFFGFSTQTYNGKVYLDPTNGVGPDLKLLFQTIGPLMGNLPTDSHGRAWNPWQPKFGERSVHDLVINFTENKLQPFVGGAVQASRGHPTDLGDITQNPVTGMLIPLFFQSALQASGETAQGGGANIGPISTITPSEAEKRRLANDLRVPLGMEALSGDRQQQATAAVDRAVKDRLNSVVQSPAYQSATDIDRQKMIEQNTQAASQRARRDFAVSLVRSAATPDEAAAAFAVGLTASPSRLDKAHLAAQIAESGGLSPDVIRRIDAQRDQPNPERPAYDPTVDELVRGAALADQWLRAPAFLLGTKENWDAAGVAASRMRSLVAATHARGERNPFVDPNLVRFYTEAADGWLVILYDRSGSRKTNLVSPARRDAERDPLWRLFGDATEAQERPPR